MNEGIARRSPSASRIGGFLTGTRAGAQTGLRGRPGSVSATGGTVSTIGNTRYHTFTASGTLTVTTGGPVEVLLVGGGGGGGSSSYLGVGGGGGGGGVTTFGIPVVGGERLTVVVGGGAAGPSYNGIASRAASSSITGNFGTRSIAGGSSGGWGGFYEQAPGPYPASCPGSTGYANTSGTRGGAATFGVSNVPAAGGGGGMGGPGLDVTSASAGYGSMAVGPPTVGFPDGVGGYLAPRFFAGITNKALTSNIATLTMPGYMFGFSSDQPIAVFGVDATFNGWYRVTTRTATTVSYAKVAANVASTAVGYVVTNKSLTSNVAELTIGAHTLVSGNTINVVGVDATFDGMYTISSVTSTTVAYSKTATNVTSQADTGYVTPGYGALAIGEGGNGGRGIAVWGTSPSDYYGGGGGGGSWCAVSYGQGGLGGGGRSGIPSASAGESGLANRGGGGGGSGVIVSNAYLSPTGQVNNQTNGGSGVVIVRYPI